MTDDDINKIEAMANGALRGCEDYADEMIALIAELRVARARVLELETPGECQSLHKLRAERDELAAEVSAYQGRPEGALPGWEWSEADGPAYVRPYGGRLPLVVYVTGQWFGDEMQGYADSPRAAMRAAEAAARSRGWM